MFYYDAEAFMLEKKLLDQSGRVTNPASGQGVSNGQTDLSSVGLQGDAGGSNPTAIGKEIIISPL